MKDTPKRCLSEQQPDENREFDVCDLLDEILEDQNKKPWTRKTGRYHPSSLKPNMCRRLLFYDRVGEEPEQNIDNNLRMLFGLGHSTHDFVQSLFAEHEGFKSELVASSEDLHLFGHCDGIFEQEDWVIEIKSIGDASFRTLVKPKEEHIWQAHCYMWSLDIPRTQILYINRNSGQRRRFRIKFDTDVWEKITALLEEAEGYVERNEAPPRTVNWYTCKSCKFLKTCDPPRQRKPY